jgi:ketosteroid isomerase-like protein
MTDTEGQNVDRLIHRTGDLRVRVYGDTALMTGTLLNTFPPPEPGAAPRQVELHALQVWVEEAGDWKLAAFASSGPPAA